jgi:hypothetical protein
MTERQERRAAAIKAFRDREARAKQETENQDRQRDERERSQSEVFATWRATTFPTILSAVQKVSNEFARDGSPLLFSHVPKSGDGKHVDQHSDSLREGRLPCAETC